MSQQTLRAAVIGSIFAFNASLCLLIGLPSLAAVLALVGAAIPTGVLYVRFTA